MTQIERTPPKVIVKEPKATCNETPMYYDSEMIKCEKEQKIRAYMRIDTAPIFDKNLLPSTSEQKENDKLYHQLK